MKKTVWLSGFVIFSVLFGICAVIIGNADILLSNKKIATDASYNDASPVFVIDPGHGGEDGGCSADDGTLEKDINLTISNYLCDSLNSMGYKSVMTRTDDRLLYDLYGDLDDYTGKKKIYDLKNRVRFAKESGAEALISIHMNKYPSPSCRGTQIYYSPNDESKMLADAIRARIKSGIQNDNKRENKKAGSNIYILNRTNLKAVLCECGFLSNIEDTALFKDTEYIKKLCFCIASAAVEQTGT